MEKKEFLTEENYEKGKKTLKKIIKVVLGVGLSLSLIFIIAGIIVILTSSNNDEKSANTSDVKEEIVYESNVRSEEEINNDIIEVNNKISELNKDLPSLKAQETSEFMSNGHSQKYYELDQQINNIESQIGELETKKRKLQFELQTRESDLEYEKNKQEIANQSAELFNSSFEEPKGLFKKGLGGILIFIGIAIIPPTLLISGVLFLIYKKREITIFTTQQTMPIAQEGIEKMAPTIGNAAGNIGKGIAEGITKGIKEGKKDEEK